MGGECCAGAPPVADYAAYCAAIDDAAAHAVARGLEVDVCEMGVADMLAALAAKHMANTSPNRAAILAARAQTLGIKIDAKAVGWALLGHEAAACPRDERPLAVGQSVAEALAGEIDRRIAKNDGT